MLRPFWRYYGGKWRAAPRYPAPAHATIVEPFAGAAGYSLRYPDREVILVEKYHVIAEIWRWLIGVSADEVLAIPEVDAVADLPAWVPAGGRFLVGMCMNAAAVRPNKRISAGMFARRALARYCEGWTAKMRDRAASQVTAIRHWRVIEGEYTAAPDVSASWFIDSPYRGRPGSHYTHGSSKLDYSALARWSRSRRGQTIVCEAAGADWLPFAPFGETNGMGGAPSREAIWTRDDREPAQLSLALEAA